MQVSRAFSSLLTGVWLLIILRKCGAGTPAPARFFAEQIVDHLDEDVTYWTQRYYVFEDHFAGPGSPIFLVLGGEGAIEPSTGLYYAFVTHILARNLGAYVLQPEHRFYGASQPIDSTQWATEGDSKPDPRINLLTSEQALLDAIRLLQYVKKKLGCQDDTIPEKYCPVIAVGGSYPGFLSAMSRLVYPQHIDMAYAASAPMYFYSQDVPATAYYEHITKVAEAAYPGCRRAVQSSLLHVRDWFLNYADFREYSYAIGICNGTLPAYVETVDTFLEEILMMVGYTFANHNMAYYPPSKETRLYKACQIFDQRDRTPQQRLAEFLISSLAGPVNDCVDMREQLPAGRKATISSGDWSGVGTGTSGESWDFQTCTLLVESIGFDSRTSMFWDRPWSQSWLQAHCRSRFHGVEPRPYDLVRRWHWDDLVAVNASRILFTNGMNDGWSVSAIQQSLSDSLLVINFPNGAHHSDLTGRLPSPNTDTEDLWEGFEKIEQILTRWINEIIAEHRVKRHVKTEPSTGETSAIG